MIKYAEILDSTWWQEEVPEGFTGRTKDIGTEEEPDIKVLTWEEYLSHNGHTWKKEIRDENDVLLKTIVIFSKNGHPVNVPVDYANAKIKFINKQYFKDYRISMEQPNAYKPSYVIYEVLNRAIHPDPTVKPVRVDFKRNTYPGLHKVKDADVTTYYLNDTLEQKVVEEHFFTDHSKIYWHTWLGRDNEFKIYLK